MLTVKQKNSTDFNRANNSCKAFDWQKFYSIPGKVFWFVSLNNIILNSSANKPITNWGQEAKKGLEGRSPQWHPSVECCDTLHHTWTFNTRRKTRERKQHCKKARTFFHTSGFSSTSSGRDSNFSGNSSDKRIRSSQPWSGSQAYGFFRALFSREILPRHIQKPESVPMSEILQCMTTHTVPLHRGTKKKFVLGSTVRLDWSAEGKMAFYTCSQKPEFYLCKHF